MKPMWSREIINAMYIDPPDEMTDEQRKINKETIQLLKIACDELMFVVNCHPYTWGNSYRKSQHLLQSDQTFMEMLSTRHLITNKVFENDQKCFALLIRDYQQETAVEYKALYGFVLYAERSLAFDGFRALFKLPQPERQKDWELHEQDVIRRRYDPRRDIYKSDWLLKSLKEHYGMPYIDCVYKRKLLARLAYR